MRATQRMTTRRKSALVIAAVLAAAAAGPSLADAAQTGTAAARPSRPGPTADPGFPTFVQLPADQAAHPGAQQEWWYTVGWIQAGGHKYGYEVQLTSTGLTQIALTDEQNATYSSEQNAFKPGQFSTSTSKLDIRMPNASLSGSLDDMHLKANLPHGEGTLDLSLKAVGPTLYNNGTGLFPFLGATSYYYSLPDVHTSGTLTLNGSSEHVTGTSWLDRQWGSWNWAVLHKWTWMPVRLSNGQVLDLWDLFDNTGEKHWATVLNPDGSERLVSIDPLAPQATDFQTSPTTGQRYAGQWTVTIPSLHAKLVVTAKPVLQEIQSDNSITPGINEAVASVHGTYRGRTVTGDAYVEQFGNWQPGTSDRS